MNLPIELALKPKGLGSARTLLWRLVERCVRPAPDLTVSQWADRYRWLGRGESGQPGRWRTSYTPYLRLPMDLLSDNEPTQDVVLWFGTQLGKTETGNNWLGYIIDLGLGSVMLIMPTSGTGKRSSKTRIGPLLKSPRIRAKLRDASRDAANTLTLKEFEGGFLVIAGANSLAELQSQPVRFVFLDEKDVYPKDLGGQGSPSDQAKARQDRFGSRRKSLHTSTCSVQGESHIEADYNGCVEQMLYFVPCPHCAHEQTLRWEQFRWETLKARELVCSGCGVVTQIPATNACPACGVTGTVQEHDTPKIASIWYECELAGCRIEERHKPGILEHARWLDWRTRQLHAHGVESVGFRLPSWYGPLGGISWKQIAEEKLEADADASGIKIKSWRNRRAAETYAEPGEKPDHNRLQDLRESYGLATVPAKALLLTASVDTQDNRLEVYVYGWGRAEECWLVDWQVLHGNPAHFGEGSVWEALERVLDKGYDHASGTKLRILALAIDEGGHHTQEVRLFARKWQNRHVFAVKGQSIGGKPVLGVGVRVDISHLGKRIERGVKLWPVGSDTAKARLYNRLNAMLEAHAEQRDPGPDRIHFPAGIPDTYFDQLTAEKLVRRPLPSGFTRPQWTKSPNARNEALDGWVYAYAAAIYAGIQRINWDQLEQTINPDQRDLFAKRQQTDVVSEEAEGANTRAPSAEPDPPPDHSIPNARRPAASGPFHSRRPAWTHNWRQ